ncbi:MAG: AAA family ATPase, partial [Gemmatimonadota bacterium]|nr:AAA family ATPase [Gemmatimonadota bacterium]
VVPNSVRDRDEAGAGYFLGREEDLSRLESVWEQTREGGFHGCLVSGAGGIGKSSLTARFATSVTARGQLALTIRCQEVGRGVPFATLADLIHALAQDPTLGSTDPHWLSEASRIAPGLKERFPGLPKPDQAPADSMKLRLAESFYQILMTITEGEPLLLAIDDIQHLDPASRDVLHVLGRRLTEAPAMLLVTVRTDELSPSTSLDREHVGFSKWHESLNLKPLSPVHVATLVDYIAEDMQETDSYGVYRNAVVQLGNGNPYFVEVLVADWRTHGTESLVAAHASGRVTSAIWSPPDTMRRIFARHYEGLSKESRRLMEVLSVAGRALDASELGALLNSPPATVTELVLEIMERGALRMAGDAISFRNDLHSAFVYFAMPQETRTFHHAALAKTFLESETRNEPNRQLEVSHHFARAKMGTQAMEHAIIGADAAVMSGAPKEAEQALRGAIELVGETPLEARVLLCAALNKQGRFKETVSIIEEMNGKHLGTSASGELAALQAEALVRGRLKEDTEIKRIVVRTLDAHSATNEEFRFANAFQIAAEFAADRGDAEGLDEAEGRARELAEREGRTVTGAQAHMTLGFCAWTKGNFIDGYRFFTASAKVLESKNHSDAARAFNGKAICAWAVGDFGLALEIYEQALYYAARVGNHPLSVSVYSNRACTLLDLGEFDVAAEWLEQARVIDRALNLNRHRPQLYYNLITLGLATDQSNEIQHLVDCAMDAALSTGVATNIAAAHYCSADFFLSQDKSDLALGAISIADKILDKHTTTMGHVISSNMARLTQYRKWTKSRSDSIPGHAQIIRSHKHLPLTAFVELVAFNEWAQQQDKKTGGTHSTRGLVRATGLYGVQKLLEQVKMFPTY